MFARIRTKIILLRSLYLNCAYLYLIMIAKNLAFNVATPTFRIQYPALVSAISLFQYTFIVFNLVCCYKFADQLSHVDGADRGADLSMTYSIRNSIKKAGIIAFNYPTYHYQSVRIWDLCQSGGGLRLLWFLLNFNNFHDEGITILHTTF